MPLQRKTPFVSVNLTEAARDELRNATLELTTPAGRRVSMSDALIAGLQVGMRHREDVVRRLRSEPETDETEPGARKAVVYLRTEERQMDDADMGRLTELANFTLSSGYSISQVLIAYHPYLTDGPDPKEYVSIRQLLKDKDIAAIVLWNPDRGVPDTITHHDIFWGEDGR